MERSRTLENYVVAFLVGVAFVLVGAIVLYLVTFKSEDAFLQSLYSAGHFLFRSFHVVAFLVALYPLFAAALFLRERSPRALFFELATILIPVLSLAVSVHILVGSPTSNAPAIAWIRSLFGQSGAVIVSALFTAGCFVAIAHLSDSIRNLNTESAQTTERVPGIFAPTAAPPAPTYAPTAAPPSPTPTPPTPTPPTPTPHPHNHQEPSQEPPVDLSTTVLQMSSTTPEPTPQEAATQVSAPQVSAPPEPTPPRETSTALHPATTPEHPATTPEHPATTPEHPSTTEPPHPVPATTFEDPQHDLTEHHTVTPQTDHTHNQHPQTHSVDLSPPVFFLSGGKISDLSPASGADDNVEPVAGAQSARVVSTNATLDWKLDPEQLLNHYPHIGKSEVHRAGQSVADKLQEVLLEFNIEAEIVGIRIGPVVTVYEVLPAPGVKVTRVSSLSDNIALRLAASRVRIEAPIPGKQAIGIEIPNAQRQIVGFDQLVTSDSFNEPPRALPVALGQDISGEPQIVELSEAPHLLIAGATGSGKSVCVNSIIASLLFRCPPHEVRMLLIDPKIVELKLYNGIPHLLTPVITDPERAIQALEYCLNEMERRYSLLDKYSVRDIASYNQKVTRNSALDDAPLPYIVIVIDEFADLMATSGKKIEALLVRLTAMSRAIGIHLVLATQRPSTDVITGLIKANIPSRIAFMVSSKIDSRIILDIGGAEQLLGKGDMLYVSARHPHPVRLQGALITDEEVLRIVEVVKEYGPPDYIDEHEMFGESAYVEEESDIGTDPLFEEAVETVQGIGKASASFLQRRLQIGYNRAARLIEEMERQGIVGPANGSKPRHIIKVHG